MTISPNLESLLAELSTARLNATPLFWPSNAPADVAQAYALALAVRARRVQDGEVPVGYKVGFTNRTIWPRYNVYAPIWGTVWQSTLTVCDELPAGATGMGEQLLCLRGLCEPRIEPEIVFCLRSEPPPGCTLAQLIGCLDWVAHGFEIVHTHFPGWQFTAAQAVADAGLHGRLLVGQPVRLPLEQSESPTSSQPSSLANALSGLQVKLYVNGVLKDQGTGANVLDGPLQALLHFVHEIRTTPQAPRLKAGDFVTTGTLTDAWPVQVGEAWYTVVESSDPLAGQLKGLRVRFE